MKNAENDWREWKLVILTLVPVKSSKLTGVNITNDVFVSYQYFAGRDENLKDKILSEWGMVRAIAAEHLLSSSPELH